MTTIAPPRAELHRPQFHLTPAATWMNDPNGLTLHEGTWHAFYQNNPSGSTWGNMSWGHAVSEDLATWQELPVALPCRDGELIFSGSVVHDAENTSGLGAPGEPGPLVAIYTSAYTETHPERAGTQAQSLAFSRDGGATWQFHTENPVLDRGSSDFRDPKVFLHAETGRWVMVAVEAVDHSVLIHTSADLRTWELASTLTDPALDGGIWECPDLVRLPGGAGAADADAAGDAWALIVSTNPGGPAGGSGTFAILGGFDGRTFTPRAAAVPLDLGPDCYAAVSFGGVEGAPVLLGWMNNWDYAELTPTDPWRSSMTLPRTLDLTADADGTARFVQRLLVPADVPVVDLGGPHAPAAAGPADGSTTDGEQTLARLGGGAVCLTGVLDLCAPHRLAVRFGEDEDAPELRIEVDAQGRVVLDRGAAHREPFAPGHARSAAFAAPTGADQVPFRLVLDASTAELELDRGRAVISQQIFPAAGPSEVRIGAAA